jgi:hypothetical protein
MVSNQPKGISMTDKELLEDYSTYLGLSKILTVEDLIKAHTDMREQLREIYLEEINEKHRRIEASIKAFHDCIWVKWEDLAHMTLEEISEMIQNEP